MKKRILSLVLSLCLILPCAFMLTACGGGDGKDYSITQTDWSNKIVDTGFYVETENCVVIRSDGNSYEKYGISQDGAVFEKTYLEGPACIYEIGKDGGVWQQMQPISNDIYQRNISPFKAIINYVKENYNLFTIADSKYTLTLTENVLQTEISSINNILGRGSKFVYSAIQVEKVFNNRNNFSLKITLLFEDEAYNVVIDVQTPLLQYEFDKSIKNLKNYVIKGGPSVDDVDYMELYYTENGFRIYNPNNPDPLRRDAYLKYDSAEDKYYQYRQNVDGVWHVEETTRSIYNNTLSTSYNMYLGNFLEQSDKLIYEINGSRCYNREVITKTNAMGTWSYFNIELYSRAGNCMSDIEKGSWSMQLKQGQAQTLVYNITLETGSVVLEYPQV